MNLVELLTAVPDSSFSSAARDLEITGVSQDSRTIRPGDLFVAIRGERADGWAHAADAAARGAAAVVSERPAPEAFPIPWVRVPVAREALARLAARLAGNPAEKLVLAAVTGTNGKTTTAMLLEGILARHYGRAGFLGTVAYRTGRREIPAPQTTPEAPLLQELLAEMVDGGVPAAAMEVSSHALALDRVAGCRFDVAVFTNLTQDHLDFHRDLDGYFDAKRKLFSMRKPGAAAVVNADDAFGRRLAAETAPPVTTWSPSGAPADVRGQDVRCDLAGTSLDVVHPAGCHTEDALRRLLLAVRDLTDKKIILVFGCGGDRDRGKRAPMGKVAGSLSDIAIATSDNPRSEDPEAILAEVERGLLASGATKYLKVSDRREAIRTAIDLANPGTAVVIAGKGHERVQVIGERSIPFDDREVASEYASRR